jgi:hypothetical protein
MRHELFDVLAFDLLKRDNTPKPLKSNWNIEEINEGEIPEDKRVFKTRHERQLSLDDFGTPKDEIFDPYTNLPEIRLGGEFSSETRVFTYPRNHWVTLPSGEYKIYFTEIRHEHVPSAAPKKSAQPKTWTKSQPKLNF